MQGHAPTLLFEQDHIVRRAEHVCKHAAISGQEGVLSKRSPFLQALCEELPMRFYKNKAQGMHNNKFSQSIEDHTAVTSPSAVATLP